MKKLLLFLIMPFFTACTPSAPKMQTVYEINIDSISEALPELAQIKYVPLETTDSSLIGNIDKILYQNNKYYILDKVEKKILVFDRQGKAMQIIHKVGQGPGEYLEPSDIDIDKEGNIYVYDWATQSIITYKNGKPENYEILKIGQYFLDFAMTDKYIFLSNILQENSFKISLALWDKKKNEMRILKNNERIEGNKLAYRANHYFYRSANIVTYYERFYPYIYQIDNDSIKYFTNLLTKKIPTKDEVEQWSQGTPSEQFMKSMQYVGDISACYETEKYIFITIQGMPPGYGIINKENNQTYYMPTHKYKNMPNGGAIATTGKEFISYMIPTEDNIQQILSSVTDTEKQLQIKSLDEESNPILVLFSYK